MDQTDVNTPAIERERGKRRRYAMYSEIFIPSAAAFQIDRPSDKSIVCEVPCLYRGR